MIFESSIFFMKSHQSVWKYLESYNWNGWTFKISYFSWILIKVYENNLNLKSELRNVWTLKVQYFSWILIKVYENHLKLISEMGNGWTLKVQYFSWKLIKMYENTLNLIPEMNELSMFNSFHENPSKCMKITWIWNLN